MEQLKEHFKRSGVPRLAEALREGRLHHAYIIEGEKGGVLKQLVDFFENGLGVSLANNPDYWLGEFPTFGIDEARMLKERQSRMTLGARKLFVLCAERLTREAQNALLKTLEEPSSGTHFFFVLPSIAHILPTVRSRVVYLRDDARASSEEMARTFLSASWSEREKSIKPLIEEKDRARALVLLYGLQSMVKERCTRSHDVAEYHSSLRTLEKCRAHLSGRAPSLKMILEYIAAVL